MSDQLFPTEPLCGNCECMEPDPIDPHHGKCPALDLRVCVKAKACRTRYIPKGGPRHDDA